MYMRGVSGRSLLRGAGRAVVLLLLFAGGPRAFAQQVNGPTNEEGLTMTELLKLPGRLIGEGRNTRPAGQLKLLSYRVEELTLPRVVKVELRGEEVEVDRAWRLTVTGGPFPVRALPAVIWVDDQVVGYGVENERLNAVTAITFDRSLLREGGTISLSYGEEKRGRVRLPEKLGLSAAR
jgi:hypothetical protein